MSQINQHQITTSLKIKKKIIKQIMIVNNQRMKIQKMNKTETTLKKIIINQIKNKIMKNSMKIVTRKLRKMRNVRIQINK